VGGVHRQEVIEISADPRRIDVDAVHALATPQAIMETPTSDVVSSDVEW
jgi:hypothetical protein